MRTCPRCGEELEDQFDSCWKCAVPPEPPPGATRLSKRWRTALVIGVLFEVTLVALSTLLPRDSWLFAKFFNFLVISHFPLLSLMEGLNVDSAVFGVLLILL